MSCSSACYTDERNSLLDFKEGLNFTFSYNTLQSWKGYNCCAWEGVACHPITAHVISLDLSPSSLNASWITDEYSSWPFMSWKEIRGGLFHLHHLEHLDLTYNAFFPPLAIPLQLHKLSKLRVREVQSQAIQMAGNFHGCALIGSLNEAPMIQN
ncbi:hypothetical protein SUGI_0485250 [Cryptomeria japonica]|nr:hypothetical protein SUGI_0485250 [Cryptomeria japonica]